MTQGIKADGTYPGLKHGWCSRDTPSPEYRAWSAIKSRCLNPNVEFYDRYGGRGITICDRWLHSFENFLADVGPRPSTKHSIDRYPDNDGNYEPDNVRWATPDQQQGNRRNTPMVQIEGTKVPLAEACRSLKLNRNAVWMRIKRGMTPEQAIAAPLRKHERKSRCG